MGRKERIPPHLWRPQPGPAPVHSDPSDGDIQLPHGSLPLGTLPPPEIMKQKLAALQMEMKRLATENHRFAVTETSLRQELAAAQQKLQRLHIHSSDITFELEQQLKTLSEKITKMKADLKNSEHVKAELQHAHAEAQSLVVERRELVSRIEHISQELRRSHVDLQQIPVMKSELEALRQEYQHWRATYDYERKLRSDHYQSLQVTRYNFISMSKEVERLRAALLNATNIDRSGGQLGANAASYNGTEPPGNHPAGQNVYGASLGHGLASGAMPRAGGAMGSAPSSSSHSAYGAPSMATGWDAPRGFASYSSRYTGGYDAARIDNIEVPVTSAYGFPGGTSVAQGAVDTGNHATQYGSVQTQSYGSAGAPSTLGSTQQAAYGSKQPQTAYVSARQAVYGSEETYGSTQQATYGTGQAPETYGSAQQVTYESGQTSRAYGSIQQATQESGQNSKTYGLSQQTTQVAYGSGQISASYESARQLISRYGQTPTHMGGSYKSSGGGNIAPRNEAAAPVKASRCAIAKFNDNMLPFQQQQVMERSIHTKQVHWNHLSQGQLEVNTGGAWDNASGRAGIGYIIRNNEAKTIMAVATYHESNSPLLTELLAIKSAMAYAYCNPNLQDIKIIFETYSKKAFNLIMDEATTTLPKETQVVIREIKHLKNNKNFSLEHIGTEYNCPAEWLANFAKCNQTSKIWEGDWPEDLAKLL